MESNGTVTETQTQPAIVRAGKITTVSANAAPPAQTATQNQDAAATQSSTEQSTEKQQATQTQQPEFTEDQRRAFFATLGVEYKGEESIEEIKNKLNPQAQPAALTEAQIKEAEMAKEKARFDLFASGGGTIEQYAAIKSIFNSNPDEFSKSQSIEELVKEGFTKEEAADIVKERFYQVELSELERNEDEETLEEFEQRKAKLEKKVAFGKKKLENKYNFAKTQAEQFFNSLDSELSNLQLQRQRDEQHAAKAEQFISTMPRKQEFQLGKLDGKDIAPISVDFEDADISDIKETLKDTAKIKQFLFNEDGSYKIENLAKALLLEKSAAKIARIGLLEGQTRATNVFRETFPAMTPQAIGVGGAPSKIGEKGKVVTAGKVQRVK